MTESYEREVQSAEEIHELVEEVHSRGTEEPVYMFLDHQEEPNVVRGYGQPYRHEDDEEIVETRRKDGGQAWYHEPDVSKCFMMAVPNDGAKNNEEVIDVWGSVMEEKLEDLGYNAEQEGADIYVYDKNADKYRQIAGLSARNPKDSTLVRCCWYEDKPSEGEEYGIDKILEVDNEDINRFYNDVEPAEELYNSLKEDLDPEEVHEDFVSEESKRKVEDYMDRSEGYISSGRCVGKL